MIDEMNAGDITDAGDILRGQVCNEIVEVAAICFERGSCQSGFDANVGEKLTNRWREGGGGRIRLALWMGWAGHWWSP